ncbi:MAG: aminotransferase class I/II-fold pyridoxal phosphate-dependent enzyme, partial [Planctomycetales bacterium]|nr:aminotransferase class I/II-fold pyridoxal phosphate-dependent enzyme [Planctomycetales bacterium]
IGYRDQALQDDLFVSCRAIIDPISEHQFKYRVDFDAVTQELSQHNIGAICVSRPTNPSGNVLTANELERLNELASDNRIPLLVDNAYGQPFPGVVSDGSMAHWDENSIFTLSLSKLGLPGTRTGIVVASEEIAQRISQTMGVLGLANTNIGQSLLTPMLEDGSLQNVCDDFVRPFYAKKSQLARDKISDCFANRFAYSYHVSEGAFFLWLTFPRLSISTMQLYEELKRRDVIVVPGEYFFFGLPDDWDHTRQCIRVSFVQSDDVVTSGLEIIADVVKANQH